MKFETVAFTVLKLCYASKSVTNGRTDGRTNNPEAICLSNFFEVGGIISRNGFHLLFVCAEVLWPSQPNGVMSSTVS